MATYTLSTRQHTLCSIAQRNGNIQHGNIHKLNKKIKPIGKNRLLVGKMTKSKGIGKGNRKKFSERTAKQQEILRTNSHKLTREDAIKGQRASQLVQKHKRTLQEILGDLLQSEIVVDIPETVSNASALQAAAAAAAAKKGETLNLSEQIAISQITLAILGNTAAAQFVRDSSGEKPKDNIQVSQQLTLEDMALVQRINDRLNSVEGTQYIVNEQAEQ